MLMPDDNIKYPRKIKNKLVRFKIRVFKFRETTFTRLSTAHAPTIIASEKPKPPGTVELLAENYVPIAGDKRGSTSTYKEND